MRVRRLFELFVITALLLGTLPLTAVAQSLISGDVTGIVSDPSGAVVPNATVTIKNNGNGHTQTTTSNASGVYRFSLLSPGSYTVTATAQGFQKHVAARDRYCGPSYNAEFATRYWVIIANRRGHCGSRRGTGPERKYFYYILE